MPNGFDAFAGLATVPDASVENAGLVIASYGQRGILADQNDVEHRYILKGRKLRVVCGDHVIWRPAEQSGDVIVTRLEERRNVLAVSYTHLTLPTITE